ncbi:MAG: response regulator [Candidatus Omnitrophota bacterium]|nr:response regulator [Candidatus Omnitrophota bacterium]
MSKQILVIDDEEAVRKAFLLALEDSGYEITTVDAGRKGIEAVKNGHFDLIFLDLRMPGFNGVQTLRGIREVNRDVPVYIVTAFHKDFMVELKSASEEGIQFELAEKPVASDQIVGIAKGVFGEIVES